MITWGNVKCNTLAWSRNQPTVKSNIIIIYFMHSFSPLKTMHLDLFLKNKMPELAVINLFHTFKSNLLRYVPLCDVLHLASHKLRKSWNTVSGAVIGTSYLNLCRNYAACKQGQETLGRTSSGQIGCLKCPHYLV